MKVLKVGVSHVGFKPFAPQKKFNVLSSLRIVGHWAGDLFW